VARARDLGEALLSTLLPAVDTFTSASPCWRPRGPGFRARTLTRVAVESAE
jgi:hypothetical protein